MGLLIKTCFIPRRPPPPPSPRNPNSSSFPPCLSLAAIWHLLKGTVREDSLSGLLFLGDHCSCVETALSQMALEAWIYSEPHSQSAVLRKLWQTHSGNWHTLQRSGLQPVWGQTNWPRRARFTSSCSKDRPPEAERINKVNRCTKMLKSCLF